MISYLVILEIFLLLLIVGIFSTTQCGFAPTSSVCGGLGGGGPRTPLLRELTSVFLSLTSLSLVLGTRYRANSPHKAVLVLYGQLKEKRRVDISKTWPLVSSASVPAFSLFCSMQILDLVFHLEFCSGLIPSSRGDTAKFSLVLCQEQLWTEAGTEPGT